MLCAAVSAVTARAHAGTITLTVGATGPYQYRTIGAAVAAANADSNANNYYDIHVAPGTYTNDFSNVTRPMTIEVDPSRAQEGRWC